MIRESHSLWRWLIPWKSCGDMTLIWLKCRYKCSKLGTSLNTLVSIKCIWFLYRYKYCRFSRPEKAPFLSLRNLLLLRRSVFICVRFWNVPRGMCRILLNRKSLKREKKDWSSLFIMLSFLGEAHPLFPFFTF